MWTSPRTRMVPAIILIQSTSSISLAFIFDAHHFMQLSFLVRRDLFHLPFLPNVGIFLELVSVSTFGCSPGTLGITISCLWDAVSKGRWMMETWRKTLKYFIMSFLCQSVALTDMLYSLLERPTP